MFQKNSRQRPGRRWKAGAVGKQFALGRKRFVRTNESVFGCEVHLWEHLPLRGVERKISSPPHLEQVAHCGMPGHLTPVI